MRREGLSTRDPLDLVIAGLGAIGAEPAIQVPDEEVLAELEGQGIAIQRASRKTPTTVAAIRGFMSAVPLPVPLPEAVLEQIPKVSEAVRSERVRTVACSVASPVLVRGLLIPHPIAKLGSMAGLALCGLEFADALEK